MSVDGLKRLKVWVRAKDFGLAIYQQVLPLLPAEEKWNLAAQLRRSSLSIPANIAEGYGRFYYQDNVRFCYLARGSLEETLSHLVFALEAKFIPEMLYKHFETEGEEIDKMLNGYISYLKKSKQGANEPGANYAVREESETYITESLRNFNEDQETTL
ncbi:MAG: four helix bundle protein [Chloroflexi bacterium]|nr:four helix bundle protein [Chloroflexota bacterium]MBI3339070.1 four helix bundle protein [Chloroflexota bacterium]